MAVHLDKKKKNTHPDAYRSPFTISQESKEKGEIERIGERHNADVFTTTLMAAIAIIIGRGRREEINAG